ncbi:MAG: hypothetical protein WBC29_02045 [Candidatus Moraniibacteriota bacterium]
MDHLERLERWLTVLVEQTLVESDVRADFKQHLLLASHSFSESMTSTAYRN